MPIEQSIRPYDPAQDPRSPITTPPHWSVIAGMLITVLSAGVTALLGVYDILKTDPLKAVLICIGAMLAAAGTVVGVAVVQGRKEEKKQEGSTKLTEAKIQAEADVAVAEAKAATPTTEGASHG